MLIEIEGNFMLIGIGCNVGYSPDVLATGRDGGRPASCLRRHCGPEGGAIAEDDSSWSATDVSRALGETIFQSFVHWLTQQGPLESAESIVGGYREVMDFTPKALRND